MSRQLADRVYGSVDLDELQTSLKSTEPVLEAEGLTQLGLSSNLFPNATHRRREHLIGSSILAGLFSRYLNLSKQETYTLESAAMLHDIGHSPFSHAAEKFLNENHFHHEKESVKRIRESKEILDVLKEFNVDPDEVIALIDGKYRGNPYGQQLIAGSLDVDRLDYLMRDSTNTTGFGDSLKHERFIQCSGIDGKIIYFTQDCLPNIEMFITVYRNMYLGVYHNRNTCAFDEMLHTALELRKKEIGELMNYSEEGLKKKSLEENNGDPRQQAAAYLARMVFQKQEPYRDLFFVGLEDKETIREIRRRRGTPIETETLNEEIRKGLQIERHQVICVDQKIPDAQPKLSTDTYIKPFQSGSEDAKIIRLEEFRPGLPHMDKRHLFPFSFRVIAPQEIAYNPENRKRAEEIILG